MKFIEIDITPEMIARAQAKADELGVLKNSIRKGAGNLAGFLGEEAILKATPKAVSENTFHHDLNVGGFKVEVKTKDRTVPPQLHYECSISSFNPNQKADYYVFVSLLRRGDVYTKAFILGFIKKADFFQRARKIRKGELDPANNWIASCDCFNLPITQLKSFGT